MFQYFLNKSAVLDFFLQSSPLSLAVFECMCMCQCVCILLRKRMLPDSKNSEKITYISKRLTQDPFFYSLTFTFIFKVKVVSVIFDIYLLHRFSFVYLSVILCIIIFYPHFVNLTCLINLRSNQQEAQPLLLYLLFITSRDCQKPMIVFAGWFLKGLRYGQSSNTCKHF